MNNYLYVVFDETITGGGVRKGQENDSWPNYETEYRHCTIVDVRRKEPDCIYFETEQVDFNVDNIKDVYLVHVTYGSGSTFGNIEGLHSFEIYDTEEKAKDRVEQINKEYKIRCKNDNDMSLKNKWEKWWGYFESLTDVTYEKYTVQ